MYKKIRNVLITSTMLLLLIAITPSFNNNSLKISLFNSAFAITDATSVSNTFLDNTGFIKVSDTNDDVFLLQEVLFQNNYLKVKPTSYFGPKTLQAVKDFQKDQNLQVDGIVGPSTKKALSNILKKVVPSELSNNQETTTYYSSQGSNSNDNQNSKDNKDTYSNNNMLPPGCTSTTGYSPLTGAKCDSNIYNPNLPDGCTSTVGYSPTTGAKCDSKVSVSLPPGCTSTTGYSSTTGQPCNNTKQAQTNNTVVVKFLQNSAPSKNIIQGEENVFFGTFIISNNTNEDIKLNDLYFDINGSLTPFSLTDGDSTIKNIYIGDFNNIKFSQPTQFIGSSKFNFIDSSYYSFIMKQNSEREFKIYGNVSKTATVGKNIAFKLTSASAVSLNNNTNIKLEIGNPSVTNLMTIISSSTGTTEKRITLISPNGGEIYNKSADQMIVKWNTIGIPTTEMLNVTIYSGSPLVSGFLTPNGTINDGIESFNLKDLPIGNDYQITIGIPKDTYSSSYYEIYDSSDSKFSIKDTTKTNTCSTEIKSKKPEMNSYWSTVVDVSKHPEIKRYRIKWFSGSWSNWYIPGVEDKDSKLNNDGSPRLIWSYFEDHDYEIEVCKDTSQKPTNNSSF